MVIHYTEINLRSRWGTLTIHKLIKTGHNKIGSNDIRIFRRAIIYKVLNY